MKASYQRNRPRWPYILFALIALVLLTMATSARAELRCAGLADVLAGLRAGYDELVLWQGFDRKGNRLIITANPDGSGWSALAQADADKFCMLFGGDSWSVGDVAPPAGKEG